MIVATMMMLQRSIKKSVSNDELLSECLGKQKPSPTGGYREGWADGQHRGTNQGNTRVVKVYSESTYSRMEDAGGKRKHGKT